MFAMRVLILLVCLASAAYGRHSRHSKYEGYTLYEIQGPAQVMAQLDGPLDLISLRPASAQWTNQLTALVALSPQERAKWVMVFDQAGIESQLVHDNLAGMFNAEDDAVLAAKLRAQRDGRSMSWDTYYRHDEINDYLDEMAELHPDLVTVINAGISSQGRQIKYAKVSSTSFQDLRKPIVFLDATIHAREWVTAPVSLYILDQLVQNPNGELTQGIDWIIIPVVNPDGYEYTHTQDRLWRKTLSTNHPGAGECPGVDGNRNFDFGWGTEAANADPCSIIYEGPTPFSEPETRVIRDAVLLNLERIQLYIALHSYGNMFLYAYGTNASLPNNGLNLHLAGKRMAAAIDEIALEKADKYIVGNAAVVLYYSTGTARDWTRSVGVPLTYTLELPGYEYNFIVPPSYVNQICSETWAGIRAQAETFIDSSLDTSFFDFMSFPPSNATVANVISIPVQEPTNAKLPAEEPTPSSKASEEPTPSSKASEEPTPSSKASDEPSSSIVTSNVPASSATIDNLNFMTRQLTAFNKSSSATIPDATSASILTTIVSSPTSTDTKYLSTPSNVSSDSNTTS